MRSSRWSLASTDSLLSIGSAASLASALSAASARSVMAWGSDGSVRGQPVRSPTTIALAVGLAAAAIVSVTVAQRGADRQG